MRAVPHLGKVLKEPVIRTFLRTEDHIARLKGKGGGNHGAYACTGDDRGEEVGGGYKPACTTS